MKSRRLVAGGVFAVCLAAVAGCGVETLIFPILEEPFPFDEPPATLGPYEVRERRIELDDLGDGDPGGITVFEPAGAEGLRPTLVWVLGVNNRAHFHQSFHEYMASWGYVELVPDTRDISFFDTQYHARNVANAHRVYARAAAGDLDVPTDPQRMALGGYSVGGSMAAFVAAERQDAAALVLWAPAPAFLWQGVDPDALLARVSQPSLFLLAELDTVVGNWPQQMQARMTASAQTTHVIQDGVHLYLQQPPSVDDRNPFTPITREDQMRAALEVTRGYLDTILEIER